MMLYYLCVGSFFFFSFFFHTHTHTQRCYYFEKVKQTVFLPIFSVFIFHGPSSPVRWTYFIRIVRILSLCNRYLSNTFLICCNLLILVFSVITFHSWLSRISFRSDSWASRTPWSAMNYGEVRASENVRRDSWSTSNPRGGYA